jgi:PAP2 superfamily
LLTEPRPGWRRWRGWIEAGVIMVAYQAFESVRARVQGKPGPSFQHARQVIRWEKALGIFHEATIQHWFLPNHAFIEFWDVWYGTIHFVIPPLALWLLYHRCPSRYRHRRDTLVALTLVSLAIFALWPLAPPRLLPASFHFVDTAKKIGGMGPADKGSLQDDNAFAAMPSLHIAWSSWCAIVLWPVMRAWWTKALAVIYPVVTLAAVVITANHFILDGVGGLIVLGIGWLIALGIERLRSGTSDTRAEELPDTERHRRGGHRDQQLAQGGVHP